MPAAFITAVSKIFRPSYTSGMLINFLRAAVLGLAFKPGTDDLREAPSLDNVQLLLENGADIYAYDPIASDNFKKHYPEGKCIKGTIHYADTIQDALRDAHICFIFTEWKEIKAVPAEEFKKLMSIPLVYDGRNIFDTAVMKAAGLKASPRTAARRFWNVIIRLLAFWNSLVFCCALTSTAASTVRSV